MKKSIRATAFIAIVAVMLSCFVGCKSEIKAPILLKTTLEIRNDSFDKLSAENALPFSEKEAVIMHYDDSSYQTYTVTKECSSLEEAAEALRTFTIDKQNTPVFKEVEFDESGGLFYTSYTFKASVNPISLSDVVDSRTYKVKISVTMPGNMAQVKGGETNENTVNFLIEDMTSEGDIAAYSDKNNVGAVLGIVAGFAGLAAVGFFVLRKKQD